MRMEVSERPVRGRIVTSLTRGNWLWGCERGIPVSLLGQQEEAEDEHSSEQADFKVTGGTLVEVWDGP